MLAYVLLKALGTGELKLYESQFSSGMWWFGRPPAFSLTIRLQYNADSSIILFSMKGETVVFKDLRFTYLLTYSMEQRVLLDKLTSSQLVRNSPHFMEPEGSLPH
jgi:hypothetical protein